jgi:hypothetical protein
MPKGSRKILVSFTKDQYALIQRFEGTLGSSMAEVVRNICLAYLSEKSYLKDSIMKTPPSR